MANILLAGDSWGIGVFAGEGDSYGPTGQGIHTVLESQGHSIINISKAGGSNWLMIDRMENRWWDTGRCLFGHSHQEEIKNINWASVDYIVFLQTDIFRERYLYVNKDANDTNLTWKKLEDKFVTSLLEYESVQAIIDNYFLKFYSALNAVGVKHNKKILMLGCWSQLHYSVANYSNLVSLVPSATQLLIPELEADVFLSDPEWYIELGDHKEFMRKFSKEFKPMTIQANRKLELIYSNWKEVHPDINGYTVLAEQLLEYFGKNSIK